MEIVGNGGSLTGQMGLGNLFKGHFKSLSGERKQTNKYKNTDKEAIN